MRPRRRFLQLLALAVAIGAAACTPPGPLGAGRDERGAARRPAGAAATGSASAAGTASAATATDAGAAPVASCRFDAAPYDPAALFARVAWLAAPERGGRVPGSPGDVAARAHVAARFACLGLAGGADAGAYEQALVDPAGRATANVIAVLPGRDPAVAGEYVVIGAHLDHLGDVDGTGDLHLGANDNASGVSALLAVAQALAERAEAPRRTVVFIAFAAEESPGHLAGSTSYAAHAPAALPMDRVVYLVNLDMVGSYASAGTVYALGAFKGTPARRFLDGRPPAARAALSVTPGAAGRGTSDHQPFCDLGVPYVFFWTPDARCYHRACDTPDHVDLDGLVAIAALTGELVSALADGETDLAAWRTKAGCRP